jgi:hypothetical protein
MDETVHKSALSAALIFALVYFIFDLYKTFWRFPYSSSVNYNDLSIALGILLLPPLILGFVSAYFFKRNKGAPTLKNFHDLGLFAVLFSLLFLSLPEAFFANYISYDWGLPYNLFHAPYGDYTEHFNAGIVIFFAIKISFIKASISILPCFLGIFIGSIVFIRPLETEKWKKLAWSNYMIVTFILLMSLYSIINSLNTPNTADCYSGFCRIQLLTPSVAYRNTSFTVTFNNAEGTKINLRNIIFNETISGIRCNITSLPEPLSVNAGGKFTVNAVCSQKVDGEPYDMLVLVEYNAETDGITRNLTATGHIKGQGEV